MNLCVGALRGRRRAVALACLTLATALLAGCSESRSNLGTASVPDAAMEAAPPEGGADGAAAEAASDLSVDVSERTVISTASLSVEVSDVEDASERAVERVVAAGGHVAAETAYSDGGELPSASLTLKVPQDGYEEALEELAELGDLRSLERRVEDVTEEVADVDSRVESAEASLARLRDLLEEAGTVEEVLAVEAEIGTRQGELEALQARQEALAGQTAYGTIELSLVGPASATDVDPSGFGDGFAAGVQALQTLLRGIAVLVGWLLPFLPLVALGGVPVWLLLRRRRRPARDAAPGHADVAADDEAAPAPPEREEG
ncbi:hypothetical protein GCM10027294_35500 [Marinactinospora endophytica]